MRFQISATGQELVSKESGNMANFTINLTFLSRRRELRFPMLQALRFPTLTDNR